MNKNEAKNEANHRAEQDLSDASIPDTGRPDTGREIETRLAAAFELAHLEVVNESHQHNVPANSQTHFKVVLVSDQFEGSTRIKRHRAINALVSDLLAGPVHALALHPYTTAEWHKRFGAAPLSPPCHGGETQANSGE